MKNIPYKKAHRLKSNRRSTAAVAQKQNQKTAAPAPPVPGDRAALIAPSFAVTPEQLAKAEKSIRLLGLTPVIYPSCRSRRDYLAGSDRLRARDLEAAFSDSSVRAVFCLRGGYGASRLLNLIDFQTIRKKSQIFYRIQRHHRTSYSAQSGVRADHLSRPHAHCALYGL